MEEGVQDRSGSSVVEAPGSLIRSFSLVIVRREKQQQSNSSSRCCRDNLKPRTQIRGPEGSTGWGCQASRPSGYRLQWVGPSGTALYHTPPHPSPPQPLYSTTGRKCFFLAFLFQYKYLKSLVYLNEGIMSQPHINQT